MRDRDVTVYVFVKEKSGVCTCLTVCIYFGTQAKWSKEAFREPKLKRGILLYIFFPSFFLPLYLSVGCDDITFVEKIKKHFFTITCAPAGCYSFLIFFFAGEV